MSWICPNCFDENSGPLEFETEEKWKEHMVKFHPVSVAKNPSAKPKKNTRKESKVDVPSQAPAAVVEKEPIKLTYKYVGNCEFCGGEIETIELDVGVRTKEHVCLAWCNNCKKKLSQRKVAKLSDESKKK